MDIHKLYRATVEASERLEEMGLKPGMVLFTYDYDQVHRPEEVQIRVAGGKTASPFSTGERRDGKNW